MKSHYENYPFPNWNIKNSDDLNKLKEKTRWQFRLLPVLSKDCQFIDVGCGTGENTLILAQDNPSLHIKGIDASYASIKKAKNNARRLNITNVSFTRRDILKITGLYDVVFCMGVVQHTQNPLASISHLSSLTKQGGTLIIGTYHRWGSKRSRDRLRDKYKNKNLQEKLSATTTFDNLPNKINLILDGIDAPINRTFTLHEINEYLRILGFGERRIGISSVRLRATFITVFIFDTLMWLLNKDFFQMSGVKE